ncbi:calcium-binding protein P-like isoform X3 [Balamuthia mandrillaris]
MNSGGGAPPPPWGIGGGFPFGGGFPQGGFPPPPFSGSGGGGGYPPPQQQPQGPPSGGFPSYPPPQQPGSGGFPSYPPQQQGSGYPPQQGGYPPPPFGGGFGGYAPPSQQQGGYPPPQQGTGYPPQQGGYPPPQQQGGGYPPQGGYPPPSASSSASSSSSSSSTSSTSSSASSSTASAPLSGGYPPFQGGYPPSPASGGAPLQQSGGYGGYPPPQHASFDAYPPQQGGYPPQQQQGSGYPPQQGGFPPPQQQGGFPPQQQAAAVPRTPAEQARASESWARLPLARKKDLQEAFDIIQKYTDEIREKTGHQTFRITFDSSHLGHPPSPELVKQLKTDHHWDQERINQHFEDREARFWQELTEYPPKGNLGGGYLWYPLLNDWIRWSKIETDELKKECFQAAVSEIRICHAPPGDVTPPKMLWNGTVITVVANVNSALLYMYAFPRFYVADCDLYPEVMGSTLKQENTLELTVLFCKRFCSMRRTQPWASPYRKELQPPRSTSGLLAQAVTP